MKTIFKLLIIGLVAVQYSCSPKMSAKKKVYDLYLFTENGKWGYIDEKGTVMIPPIYEGCCFDYIYGVCSQNFSSNHYCAVKKGGKFGVIDAKGNEIIAFQYDDISFHSDDTLFEAKSNDKWGVIDAHNNLIFPFVFNDKYDFNLYSDCGYGKIKDVVYKLDYKTKEMIPTNNANIYGYYNDYIEVKVDGKYGFLNKKGEMIVQPIYQNSSWFEEGLAAVQLDGKWGFIDTLGNMVIKPQFDHAESFGDGNTKYAVVQIDEKFGAIDRSGNFVIKPVYDNLIDASDPDFPKVLFAACLKNDKGRYRWGLINLKEEWVLANDYQYLFYDSDNQSVSAKNGEGVCGVFNLKTGKGIIPFEYESIGYYYDDGLTLFSKRDKNTGQIYFGYFDKNGKVIWQEKIR